MIKTRGSRKKKTNIKGVTARPRLSVFRSNINIFAQVIDDTNGTTLASASSLKLDAKLTKVQQAVEVGSLIAKELLSKNINTIVFDRGAYIYTGRVRALADSARAAGLKF